MSARNLNKLSVEDLIEEFVRIGTAQDDALLIDDNSRYNVLYGKLQRVNAELKSRPGDARRKLTRLYGHRNFQVWLNAARATLALAPAEARKQLEAIHRSRHSPQAMDAGMALWNLDEGVYKPT
jgi:hypothetical protein